MSKADEWNRFADAGRALLVGGAVIAPPWRKDFRSSFNALTAILAASSASKAIKAFWREPRPNAPEQEELPVPARSRLPRSGNHPSARFT